ncbi:uncharacterized protein [Chironomus tepperi]|uniref:uncharacterized protein n=1 Tax=Chironomus tepperi TaxID=113505 RepID=UPI00391F067A
MHMHMGFWWGTDIGDLFIKGFAINGSMAVIFLCISLFILSIVSEALKVHKTRSKAKAARDQRSVNSENTVLLNITSNRKPLAKEVLNAIMDASSFALHNTLIYGLMLVVMMYNGFIFIAVVFGAFVGYFLFGHISMKTNMENLQAIQTKIICSTRCKASDEPCSSGTTPIIAHTSTNIDEYSRNTVSVMHCMQESDNYDSMAGDETSIIIKNGQDYDS